MIDHRQDRQPGGRCPLCNSPGIADTDLKIAVALHDQARHLPRCGESLWIMREQVDRISMRGTGKQHWQGRRQRGGEAVNMVIDSASPYP